MRNKLIQTLLFVTVFLLLVQVFSGNKNEPQTQDDILLNASSQIVIGNEVVVTVQNKSASALTLPNPCPKNPLQVEFYENGQWSAKQADTDLKRCEDPKQFEIPAGGSHKFSYAPWNFKLFDKIGQYRFTLKTTLNGVEKVYTKEIGITAPGIFRQFWREVFYRPIYNILIFFISILPGHDLGWGIILLTLLIKIILLGPNQKALRSQKAMQKIQPELEALKIKYKNDSQALAKETMAIWQKHKVNPLNSCLPILIQFPVLIALFYVVKDGLGIANPQMLYAPFKNFNVQEIRTVFLGIIDLAKINLIVLPVIIGIFQFIQIRLTLSKTKAADKTGKESTSPMPMMNTMMQYVMPVMIAFFTASLPAAVGFYWGVSTLFGIGQQVVVNRAKD